MEKHKAYTMRRGTRFAESERKSVSETMLRAPRFKKFDGKKYSRHDLHFKRKTDAKKEQEIMQGSGFNARIVFYEGFWYLYTRQKN